MQRRLTKNPFRTFVHPAVPDATLDAALILNAYHEIEQHQLILAAVRRPRRPMVDSSLSNLEPPRGEDDLESMKPRTMKSIPSTCYRTRRQLVSRWCPSRIGTLKAAPENTTFNRNSNSGKEHVMSRVTSRLWTIPAAVTVVIVLGTTTGGQTPQEPNQDTLGALLVEVRGLRSAIEQMASVGPSIQLAMGRLQLQEQCIRGAQAGRRGAGPYGKSSASVGRQH